MKALIVVILFAMVTAVGWFELKQSRLDRRLFALQAQNQALAAELSGAHASFTQALQNANNRLAETELALTLAEQRLGALTSQINDAQRQWNGINRTVFEPGSRITRTAEVSLEPRLPASSHSPTGELLHRSWGPEQVLGPPNTMESGDIPTAWASRSPNNGPEWLKLEYDRPVDLAEVRVRESYNPGAIAKVTAIGAGGEEVVVWEGAEPAVQAPVDTSFPISVPVRANSIKVYLDTSRVSGWSEIDAVELVGRDGTRQWASAATASSTYAEP